MKNQNQISLGIPYSSGATSTPQAIPNNVQFSEIILKHTTGSFTGDTSASYTANTVLEWIRVRMRGEYNVFVVGDADADAVPWPIQLLRERNSQKAGVAEPAEYYRIVFPDAQPRNHDAQVEFKWRAIADIQGTAAATAYSGTVDVLTVSQDKIVGRDVRMAQQCGKFSYAANSGYIDNFINPTLPGYRLTSLWGVVEDNGTASNTAIDKIIIMRGNKVLVEATVPELQAIQQARSGLAVSTGFFAIPMNELIGPQDLKLRAYISSAGTSVDLHWLATYVR